MSTKDKWSALSMKDKADLIKLMVENGVTLLDDMKLYYNGGEKPTAERKQYDGKDITLETYKQLQRDKVINSAVQKALTRNEASIPTINGVPQRSCIYTATDNFGNKYKVMGNQTFMANPQKYGFTFAGPLSDNPDENIGRLYQFIDAKKVPHHIAIITGKDEKGEPLISYSKGNVTLGKSIEELEKENYVKNNNIWQEPWYETYKFVGTPDDNIIWENEFNQLPNIETLPTINNYAKKALKKELAHYNGGNLFGEGGPEDRQKMYNSVKDRIIQQTQAEQMTTQPKVGEQPLIPLEYDIADLTTGVGDIELGKQVINNVANGNLKSAAVSAGIMLLPNVLSKKIKKAGTVLDGARAHKTPSEYKVLVDKAKKESANTDTQTGLKGIIDAMKEDKKFYKNINANPETRLGQIDWALYPEVEKYMDNIYLPMHREKFASETMDDYQKSILNGQLYKKIPTENTLSLPDRVGARYSPYSLGHKPFKSLFATEKGDIQLLATASHNDKARHIAHEDNHAYMHMLINSPEYNDLGIREDLFSEIKKRFAKYEQFFKAKYPNASYWDELLSTNNDNRMGWFQDYNDIYKKYATKEELFPFIKRKNDDDLLFKFRNLNGYGRAIMEGIDTLPASDRAAFANDLRWLLTTVPAAGIPFILPRNNVDNNQTQDIYKNGGKF